MSQEESPTDPIIEEAGFLFRTPVRVELVDALAQGSKPEAALCDELEEPQATVHQNLGLLCERGLVQETPSGYELTVRGRGLDSAIDVYHRQARQIERLEPFLQFVPVSDLNLHALADAELVMAEPNNPFATIRTGLEYIDGATSLTGFSPDLIASVMTSPEGRFLGDDPDIEFIFQRESFEGLTADEKERIQPEGDQSNVDLYVTDGALPFTLLLVPGALLIGAFDDRGLPRGLLVAENQRAIDWGNRVLDRYLREVTAES